MISKLGVIVEKFRGKKPYQNKDMKFNWGKHMTET